MKCGNCKGKHQTVAQVKLCYYKAAEDAEGQAQADAELAAEKRNERFWEERGAQEDDRIEREAWMREDLLKDELQRKADEEREAAAVLDKLSGQPSGFNPDPPSDKQIAYVMDLLSKKVWPQQYDEADLRNMARRQISKLIEGLKAAPFKSIVGPVPEPEVGMYHAKGRLDTTVVRVYLGQKSGRNLSKMIVIKANGKYGYKYLGAATSLAQGRTMLGDVELVPMSLDEAKEWGRLTGCCVVCGRRLDVPESVEAGIGPVCASRQWGAA